MYIHGCIHVYVFRSFATLRMTKSVTRRFARRKTSFCALINVVFSNLTVRRYNIGIAGVKPYWNIFFKSTFSEKESAIPGKQVKLMQQAKSTDSVRKWKGKIVSKVSKVSNFCVGIQIVNFKLIYIIYILYI